MINFNRQERQERKGEGYYPWLSWTLGGSTLISNRKGRQGRKGEDCYPWLSWPLGGYISGYNRQGRQREQIYLFFAPLLLCG